MALALAAGFPVNGTINGGGWRSFRGFRGCRTTWSSTSTLEYELVPHLPSNSSVSAHQLNPGLALTCLLCHLCASCSSSRLFLLLLAPSMMLFPECWRLPAFQQHSFHPPSLFHGCYVFRQHYMCFSFALAVRDGWYSIIHVIMGYSGSGSALQDSLFALRSQTDFQGKFLFPKVLICIGCYCHKHMKSLHGFEIPNFLFAGPLSFQSWKYLCNLERQNSGSDRLLKHQIREFCLDL